MLDFCLRTPSPALEDALQNGQSGRYRTYGPLKRLVASFFFGLVTVLAHAEGELVGGEALRLLGALLGSGGWVELVEGVDEGDDLVEGVVEEGDQGEVHLIRAERVRELARELRGARQESHAARRARGHSSLLHASSGTRIPGDHAGRSPGLEPGQPCDFARSRLAQAQETQEDEGVDHKGEPAVEEGHGIRENDEVDSHDDGKDVVHDASVESFIHMPQLCLRCPMLDLRIDQRSRLHMFFCSFVLRIHPCTRDW
eukprot:gene5468-biopygen3198